MKLEEYQTQKTKMEKYEELTKRIEALQEKYDQTIYKYNQIITFTTGSTKTEYKTYPEANDVDIDFQIDVVKDFALKLGEKIQVKIAALEAEREAL